MPELPSQAKVEATFLQLIDNYEGHDIGLQLFDDKIRRLTDAANLDGGSFSNQVERGVEALNEEWLYHDDTAVVTGRLHIIDVSVIPDLREACGEPSKDEHGNLSIFVEDMQLRSYGIFDGPHGRPLNDGEVEAKIGYGFALKGDDSPMAQVILYPGEASRHEYTLPTPQAIEAKLHNMWPEKMSLVDQLLSAENTKVNDLPRRLAFVARHLQDDLVNSADGREWLSVHVNERLKLDKLWPYAVTAKDTVYFLDDETGNQWQEMTIEDPVRLDVRKPRIEFIKNQSDGAVQALLFAELPDAHDEWEGSPVGISVTDILHIRGTRAHRSLIDRALAGDEQNFAAALTTSEYDDYLSDDNEPVVAIRPPRQEHHGGLPPFIKDMMLLRSEISQVIELTKPIVQKRYDTYEQAAEASQAIVNTIGNRLIGAGIANYPLCFEGQYALRANTAKDGRQVELGETLIKVDAEHPFSELMHGDSFTGSFYAFHGDVLPINDEEGESLFYTAVPRIVMDIKTETTTALNYGPLPMIGVSVYQRGMAPLDGSVSITIPSLERYEADLEARKMVAATLGKHPVARRFNRLFAAMHAENPDGYQDLRRVGDIRAVSKFVESQTDGSRQAFEAISALLLNRPAMITGLLAGTDDDYRFVEGIIVDVSMSLSGSEATGPYVTVCDKNDGEYISLRMSTIESMAY